MCARRSNIGVLQHSDHAASSPTYLVKPIAQLLEQLFQGVDLINADCKKSSNADSVPLLGSME